MEKNQKRLTRNLESPVNPSWSPDGQRIAFDAWVDGNSEIYAIDSEGKNLDRMTDNLVFDFAPAWSYDGRKIAFQRFGSKIGHSEILLMTSD